MNAQLKRYVPSDRMVEMHNPINTDKLFVKHSDHIERVAKLEAVAKAAEEYEALEVEYENCELEASIIHELNNKLSKSRKKKREAIQALRKE